MRMLDRTTPLRPGDPLPDLYRPSTLGRPLSLGEFAGRPLVLFLFLRDDSGGCAVEACRFRDLYADFQDLGVNVLGACVSHVVRLKRFVRVNQLPFPLVSDPDLDLMTACGIVRGEGGAVCFGRATFLADADLRVARAYEQVAVAAHAAEVLADAVSHLAAPGRAGLPQRPG